MDTPEYLLLFSNSGDITVKVVFKDYKGQVAEQSMSPDEVNKLTTKDGFLKSMTFDEWPFKILKYEINPICNELTIHACQLEDR